MLIQFSNELLDCFLKIGANFESINNFYVILKKMNQLLAQTEEKNEDIGYCLDGDILFHNVTIYEEGNVILKQVNLCIKKNQKVAVVGENGSGKTILAKTLLGFYDYDGEIYIHHHNIRRLNKSNIRKHVELLFGEAYIFSGTIWDNLMVQEGIKRENVIDVLKQCELYDEIQNMEKTYDTRVGEKGIKLSGGQKQRLALARSLIRNKPILILDEAFNKIDAQTKESIHQNLEKIHKTMIFIGNELETLEQVDFVIWIQGQTTITGKHTELMKNNHPYYQLIQARKDWIMK